MYRCEEAARRGIAYCGRSTIASTGVDQVSVHHTEPQGGANMPLSRCTPGEKSPALLADGGQKSPAVANQTSNSAALLATPEEAKETSSQHSVSLGSSSCSYESNEGSTLPEEYHKFRSKPGDPHSDRSTSESGDSSSEDDREDLSVQIEQHQPESLTIPDDPEDNATNTSPETWAQLQRTRLESSSSPCSEETEDDDHPLPVVHEGYVSPNHHSSGSDSSSYSEEDDDDENMPVVQERGGGRLERLAMHQLDPGVIDLSPDDKVRM